MQTSGCAVTQCIFAFLSRSAVQGDLTFAAVLRSACLSASEQILPGHIMQVAQLLCMFSPAALKTDAAEMQLCD